MQVLSYMGNGGEAKNSFISSMGIQKVRTELTVLTYSGLDWLPIRVTDPSGSWGQRHAVKVF